MKKHDFTLVDEYIELISLLKYLDIAQSGGHAKILVDGSSILVNGSVELRRRYKVRKGDSIVVKGEAEITVI